MNHKETGWRRLTRINNNEVEKFRLNLSNRLTVTLKTAIFLNDTEGFNLKVTVKHNF